MGNPIFEPGTGEKQFERIKITCPETYAQVAARIESIRTTRRTRQARTSEERHNSNHLANPQPSIHHPISTEQAMLFSRGDNEHPIRAFLDSQHQEQLLNNIPSTTNRSNSSYRAISSGGSGAFTSANELEEIIMRQLRPRSISTLFSQQAYRQEGGGGQDFVIQESDYQTMETVMGRLRRQLRNSTARMAQSTDLTHRSSVNINQNGESIAAALNNSSHAAANGGSFLSPREQLDRLRRARQERLRASDISHGQLNPFERLNSIARLNSYHDRISLSDATFGEEEQDDDGQTTPRTRFPPSSRESLERRLEALIRMPLLSANSDEDPPLQLE